MPEPNLSVGVARFGVFEVDLRTGELRKNGVRVKIQEQPLQVLAMLLARSGEVVTREELRHRLWPGDTFVDFDNSLNTAINKLREALGDSADSPRFVETVPRRGYRFIAPMHGRRTSLVEAARSKGLAAFRAPAVLWALALGALAVAVAVLLLVDGAMRSRRSPVLASPYIQLTNYADSATSPAVSPDGRMLAFIRGESTFFGPGEVNVKLLPDGESFQLTHDNLPKMSPVFSPDGVRVSYTTVDRGAWDTWVVPVPGGNPRRMLPNASGLTWIGDGRVLFSEITSGAYMKIGTATESRAEERDVYRPPSSELSMAHRSYLSPDHKWVLVSEMDPRGWLPCRLVPFDGTALGKRAGPVPSKCTGAAWSPDGKWMYFAADSGPGFHIWRQRFPDGQAEQITFGATEEEGIALIPDGRTLITSVGAEQSTVWLHEPAGERQISSEGYAYTPSVSPDGRKVYYLVRAGSSRAFVGGELWVSDIASAARERVLSGFLITRYDISPDGRRVVFAASDASERSTLWLAQLDRRSSPRRLTTFEASRPFFGPDGDILFLRREDESDYVYRMKEDGTGGKKVVPDPVIYLIALSPDGRWLITWVAHEGAESTYALVSYPTRGGPTKLVCSACNVSGPYNPGAPMVSWARDQRFLYFRSILGGMGHRTFVIPLRSGEALPELPLSGLRSDRDLLGLQGAQVIEEEDVFPGSSPSVYALTRKTTRRNLYSIRVPSTH